MEKTLSLWKFTLTTPFENYVAWVGAWSIYYFNLYYLITYMFINYVKDYTKMLSNKPKFLLLLIGRTILVLRVAFCRNRSFCTGYHHQKILLEQKKYLFKKQCMTKAFVKMLLSNKDFHGCFRKKIIKLTRFIRNFWRVIKDNENLTIKRKRFDATRSERCFITARMLGYYLIVNLLNVAFFFRFSFVTFVWMHQKRL